MLSGWCARQYLGPFLRLSLRNPTRVFSYEETPQTSQRLILRGNCWSDALDFTRAIGATLSFGQGPSGVCLAAHPRAVSLSNVYIV
jgi:hypothetical protein